MIDNFVLVTFNGEFVKHFNVFVSLKKSTANLTKSKTSFFFFFFLKNAFKIKRNNTICRNCPLSNQVDFIGDKDDGFVDFQFVSDFVEVIFGNLEG